MNLTTNSNPSQLVPATQPQSDLDQMFSGLGLDEFMGGSGTDATPKSPQVNGNVNYNTSLTLKDKQRCACVFFVLFFVFVVWSQNVCVVLRSSIALKQLVPYLSVMSKHSSLLPQ